MVRKSFLETVTSPDGLQKKGLGKKPEYTTSAGIVRGTARCRFSYVFHKLFTVASGLLRLPAGGMRGMASHFFKTFFKRVEALLRAASRWFDSSACTPILAPRRRWRRATRLAANDAGRCVPGSI
jgi:hypothetical protein